MNMTGGGLAVGLLVLLFFAGCIQTTYSPKRFEKIEPGMSQREVCSLVGWPDGDWMTPEGQAWTYADYANQSVAKIIFDQEGRVVTTSKSSTLPSHEHPTTAPAGN